MLKLPLCSLALILLSLICHAQNRSNAKFGKISSKDFESERYTKDTSAHAVVIADIGSIEIEGNNKGGFSNIFKRFTRIYIADKNGYSAAEFKVPVYTDGKAEEKIIGLKAVTYNLKDGQITESSLDPKHDLFTDKINNNLLIKKFTLPNIKEGSIIDVEYKLHSDFMSNLQPWNFQGSYPVLWSEFSAELPDFYEFTAHFQGYHPFHIENKSFNTTTYIVSGGENETDALHRFAMTGVSDWTKFMSNITRYRWVMKDVPALREENFTSSLSNHIAGIQFQLVAVKEPFYPKTFLSTWEEAASNLLKDEDFGASLTKDNVWLNEAVAVAAGSYQSETEKAQRIFNYVRDNFTCKEHSRKYLTKPLKKVFTDRNGNVAEINLLLTAMLFKAGLRADPVLLSTKSHGFANAAYPLLNKLNYVICQVIADGRVYYLDASHSKLGFGRLLPELYNGHARVINELAFPLEFKPDSLKEDKVNFVVMVKDPSGGWKGSIKQDPGYFESYNIRKEIEKEGKENFIRELKNEFPSELTITATGFDSLNNFDVPLITRLDFTIRLNNEDLLYINPVITDAWKTNPFKSAERFYPVEMLYPFSETYLLRMDVPEGYVTEELPKEMLVKFNDKNEGIFEYRISEADGVISVRSIVKLKRAVFSPDEYEQLREFFNLVVKKQAEQIVFRRKS